MLKEMKVTLEELYTGSVKNLTFERHRVCAPCEGKGGKDAKKCDRCKGQGMIQKVVQLGPGFMSSSTQPCDVCRGEGTVYDKKNQCKNCKGEKIVAEKKTIEVPIDQGAPNEHHVTFAGEGNEIVFYFNFNIIS